MITPSNNTLQSLPDPTIIESLDYENILFDLKTDLKNELCLLSPEAADTLSLESEPLNKLLQVITYRIVYERKRANDQALALMLAKAQSSQLDHLGSLPFINTYRKIIIPANQDISPATNAVVEDDEEYRARLQIALEGFSTAGSIGAYTYHGLAAHEDIHDIAVAAPTFSRLTSSTLSTDLPENAIVLLLQNDAGLTDPLPGDVAITVLSRHGDGSPSDELIHAVETALSQDTIRPLTDRPRCLAAEIKSYQVNANVWYYPSANPEILLQQANKNVADYTKSQQRIGYDITLSGLHAAIHLPGTQRVELIEPKNDILINHQQASYCTQIILHNQGVAI